MKDYLAKKGVAEGLLFSTGIGPDRPLTTNDTAEGRSQNRRVEFLVK